MARSPAPRAAIEQRANGRCEYCRAPQRICGYRFHIEHIVPRSRGGTDDPSNLALACGPCNLAKGSRTYASDPGTSHVVDLFHPRHHRWEEHFTWSDDCCTLIGLTAIGRATIAALDVNLSLRQEARIAWRELGLLP